MQCTSSSSEIMLQYNAHGSMHSTIQCACLKAECILTCWVHSHMFSACLHSKWLSKYWALSYMLTYWVHAYMLSACLYADCILTCLHAHMLSACLHSKWLITYWEHASVLTACFHTKCMVTSWVHAYMMRQGILKGEVSMYSWPPVWLVWISPFCK